MRCCSTSCRRASSEETIGSGSSRAVAQQTTPWGTLAPLMNAPFDSLRLRLHKRPKPSAVWCPVPTLLGWAKLHSTHVTEWRRDFSEGRPASVELVPWAPMTFDEWLDADAWLFLAYHCGCVPMAREHSPEGLEMVSLAHRSGRHAVYAVDDWEWGLSALSDSLEDWVTVVTADGAPNFKALTGRAPAHEDPLQLFKRAEWLASLFCGTDPFAGGGEPEVPAPSRWRAERAHLVKWPHLATYWLVHFMLLGDPTLLDEALELAMPHAQDPLVGPLARFFVAQREAPVSKKKRWLVEAAEQAAPALGAWRRGGG